MMAYTQAFIPNQDRTWYRVIAILPGFREV